jgi:Undecaprenyl-phosphate glucose phosphotransferase
MLAGGIDLGTASLRLPEGVKPFPRRLSTLHSRTVMSGVVRMGDVAVIVLACMLAIVSRFVLADMTTPDVVLASGLIGILASIILFPAFVSYRLDDLTALSGQLPRLLGGWTALILALIGVLFAFKGADSLSRLWVASWWVSGLVLLALWRLATRRWVIAGRAAGHLTTRIVLVGTPELVRSAREGLGDDPGRTLVPMPIDPAAGSMAQAVIAALLGVMHRQPVHQVVLALPWSASAEIEPVLRWLRGFAVDAWLYPDATRSELRVLGTGMIGKAPLLRVLERPLDGGQAFAKTLFDRAIAGILLLFISPLLLVLAAMVRFSSPGPIFYRQIRHGFNHEPIGVLKFRSMYAELCDAPDAREVRQALRHDKRITPIGGFLRRTSLDELPQLWNVFRGEMSLVGPRPHAMAHNEHFAHQIDGYLGRHRVRPGITGWAQVNGCRGETRTVEDMRRRVELDLYYIDNWSLLLDIQILLRTVLVGFAHRNAY